MSFMRRIRQAGRSNSTTLLLLTVIVSLLLMIHLYQKQEQQERIFQSILNGQWKNLPLLASETGSSSSTKNEENLFAYYASDEHLLSLLQSQANADKQVVVTIIGGDSYSLYAWDWHERMQEVSNQTNKCHCFVVAMDEIAVILAIQQNVPVYYSTFTVKQQMNWINTIEARQHSLYRVGHAKFNTAARVVRLGYSVFLTELDVFWKANPLANLKSSQETYDLEISDHFGSHPRVNIGLFFVRSSSASIAFFSHVAEFWMRYGKGGFVSDQRVLDALLNNYDRLDKTYLRAMPTIPTIKWTKTGFGYEFFHLMTDGSAFMLFNQAAKKGIRSKKFYGDANSKFFTVTVSDSKMGMSARNLLIRSLLILQHTHLKNSTLILPAFTSNITAVSLFSQLDLKKFFLYWSDERVRLPEFLDNNKTQSIPISNLPFSLSNPYDHIHGIINFTLDSIPLDLPPPSPQFEVFIRDSLLWCASPIEKGTGWCIHHPRDYGATMEILFACVGDPYPPCANKTEKHEQFLLRPYEKDNL